MKADLRSRGEAGDLFGLERGDALAALLGNLEQSVFGESAYPTIERKAAHLLYFVIKNHPLSDGNKRTGALLFILEKAVEVSHHRYYLTDDHSIVQVTID